VDLNIGKSIRLPNSRALGEGASLEIKADMLNVFNITNLDPGTINTDITSVNNGVGLLGKAGGALGSRYIDFQARFSF